MILEGLAAVDEHYGNFIIELPAKFEIGVDVNFAPGKTSSARKLNQALLHHFAEMASFAGVDNDVARICHGRGF